MAEYVYSTKLFSVNSLEPRFRDYVNTLMTSDRLHRIAIENLIYYGKNLSKEEQELQARRFVEYEKVEERRLQRVKRYELKNKEEELRLKNDMEEDLRLKKLAERNGNDTSDGYLPC